jgi:predicted metal-binding protein
MSPPVITICSRCDDGDAATNGQALFQTVKALRKRLGLKDVFELDAVKCLGLCRSPCNVVFEGKKRSTYTRTQVHATLEAEAVVWAARAYAALAPGEELPERKLPGLSAD